MGKQRSKILRKKAHQLIEAYPDKFTDNFEKNKQILKDLNLFTSTTDRNICTGILVRLLKTK